MILSLLKKLKTSGNKRIDALLDFYKKDQNDLFILYGPALEYMSENEAQKAEEFFNRLLKKRSRICCGISTVCPVKGENETNR